MMKKRNMALAMAAVTVAGTIAPVVASAAQTQDNITVKEYATLESKIKEMLAMTYSEKAEDLIVTGAVATGKPVYNITVDGTTIDNLQKLKVVTDKINSAKSGEQFEFTIVDNGHAVKSDKTITNKGVNTYSNTEIVQFAEITDGKKMTLNSVEYTAGVKFDDSKLTQTIKFTKKGETSAEYTLVLKGGDNKKDFAAPVFSSGKLIGFSDKEEALESNTHKVTVSNIAGETVVVSSKNAEKIATELVEKYVFNNIAEAVAEAKAAIKEVKGGYETILFADDIRINLGTKNVAARATTKAAQIILSADTKAELEAVLDAMIGNAEFVELKGTDRIETAINISKQDSRDRKNVVLVGYNAIVDGLAAAPLAAKTDAPILITDSAKLSENVKEEIIRTLKLTNSASNNADNTVYLVGGEAVISKEVEAELGKLGVKVKRLAGDDRFETSLAIAKEVGMDAANTYKDAYVVGGYGLADAMSIAPVAADKIAPIVVVDGTNGLTAEAKTFLKQAKKAEVIGGEAVVSKTVLEDVAKTVGVAERVAGDTRHETNALVIEKHFKDETKFYVAKDGYGNETQLVDALAAAPVAGNEGAPIILSTEVLSVEQAVAVKTVKKTGEKSKLVQVGGGVKTSVVDQVKKLLGL